MAIIRWDPYSEMMTMQRDMNRLFSSLGMPLYGSRGDCEQVSWTPTVDVLMQGDDLVVRAELPGVKPEDVDVSVTGDVLTVSGTRKEEQERREGDYLRKESSYGYFERQVMLPQGIDTSAIDADYRDGILTVTVPQAAREVKPQRQQIPISSGKQGQGGSTQTQLTGQGQPAHTETGQQTGGGTGSA
jgi:HSP20 family protein